jgi:hypothetical protein
MFLTGFQNYLSKTYDDSNENNWFSENTWGQFINIESQFIIQFKDVISYFISLDTNTTAYQGYLNSQWCNTNTNTNTNTSKQLTEINVKSIPRIKSTRTLDLENNTFTIKSDFNCIKNKKEALKKYTYFSITGMLLCIYIYVNS